ncbi:fimbria/pilus outer membrane usher protein [Vibrio japonicus]|uniref:fimbria/pilus outer membrane usher protein n=1 Tax=Vibrio japonicus TaxID=1824638 RepID=UPI0027BA9F7B|nr:fimbria/pilus outer membrane usher protein [Vibrio japonicus]
MQASQSQINATGRDIELTTLLRVSDRVVGDVNITITADNDILLPKESTIEVLKSVLSREALTRLEQRQPQETLSQSDFESIGLGFTFDYSTFECVISIPSHLALTQNISLIPADSSSNYLEPELISGYINVNLSGNEARAQSKKTQREYHHRLESAVNFGAASLEYESSYHHTVGENSLYFREGTRLNFDIPNQGTRLVLGDMYNAGKSFQDGADILGIGLTRDFSLIPTKNVRPKAARSFVLTRTSDVNVVVDGIVVQRLTLNAGSYSLNDIPIAQGNNEIELIISDSTGKEERINFSVATGNGLLDSGEYEYSLMVGVPKEINNNQNDYLTDQKIVHGYLDFGLTSSMTIGVNAQSREDVYQYGSSVVYAFPFGVTELSVTQSQHPDLKSGHAYRFAFDAAFEDSGQASPQMSLIYEQQTPDFVGISEYGSTNYPVNLTNHYVALFGSVSVGPSLRASINTTFSSGVVSTNDYWSVSPSLTGYLFDTPVSWSTRVNYKKYLDGDDDFATSFTLNWPLGQNIRSVGRYSSERKQGTLDVSYQNDVGSAGGISAYASMNTDESTDSNVNAGATYTGNRFRALFDHNTRVEDIDEGAQTHNTRLEVASALAFSGRSFSVGRPVGDAFAIIEKHASLSGNNIAIDPEQNSQNARVFLTSNQSILLPDLVAYNGQIVGYDVENLRPGYDLGDGAFWLNPGYKQGFRLKIGSDSVLTVMGTLRYRTTNEPIPLIAGTAWYLGEEEQAPVEFFTSRTGRFALSGVRPGQYRLALDTNEQQAINITLDEGSDVLIMLGDLYVD